MVNESFKIIEMIQYGSSIILTRVKIIMTWFRLRIYQKKRWNDTLEFIFDYLTLNHLNLHNRPRSYAYLTRYWANNANHYAKNWPIRGHNFFNKVVRGQKLKGVSVTFGQLQIKLCKRRISVCQTKIWIFRKCEILWNFWIRIFEHEISKWNNHFNKRSMLSHRLEPKHFYWN